MTTFTYQRIKVEDEEDIADAFCAKHATLPNGLITDAEFDVIYDHLVAVLKRFSTYSEGRSDGDYSSSRYVDQTPWIRVVAQDHIAPSISVQAGLKAVQTSSRPLAIAFDYYPHLILVLPPSQVFSTYDAKTLQNG